MTEDITFTSADLTDGKLVIPNTGIVEFSVENNNGELVAPSRLYSESSGSTEIDLSGWDIQDVWHIRKIPVEPGKDAEPGVSLEEYMLKMYLLKGDGKYLPYAGIRPSFPIVQEKKAPILGTRFFASGTEQLVAGETVSAVIPAFGEMRQYIGTSEISAGSEGILYQFQVYRDHLMIFDQIQDSLSYPANYSFHGNVFYFPENVPARHSPETPKYTYYWRVRASYKLTDASGNFYWSGWSHTFPFTVNLPPGTPFDLSVSATAS